MQISPEGFPKPPASRTAYGIIPDSGGVTSMLDRLPMAVQAGFWASLRRLGVDGRRTGAGRLLANWPELP